MAWRPGGNVSLTWYTLSAGLSTSLPILPYYLRGMSAWRPSGQEVTGASLPSLALWYSRPKGQRAEKASLREIMCLLLDTHWAPGLVPYMVCWVCGMSACRHDGREIKCLLLDTHRAPGLVPYYLHGALGTWRGGPQTRGHRRQPSFMSMTVH